MTLFDFICQALKAKGSQPSQVALTVRLHSIKDWPKPRKTYCLSRPGSPVREHRGKGGLQSCRENRKSCLIRCGCECVCVVSVVLTTSLITTCLLLLRWPLRLECWWKLTVTTTSREQTMEFSRSVQVNKMNEGWDHSEILINGLWIK